MPMKMKKQPPPISKLSSLYFFGAYEGLDSESVLGNKGACLTQMMRLGLPVPPGFTLTTAACTKFLTNDSIFTEVQAAVASLGQKLGKQFGSGVQPLFLSVRSGAAVSMPGMMDTILNIGINDEIAQTVAAQLANPAFIYDSYCRLIHMYAHIVMQAGGAFSTLLSTHSQPDYLTYKQCFYQATGQEFPQDVHVQLKQAIIAVLRSWQNARAVVYRQLHNITESTHHGTALNIQAMASLPNTSTKSSRTRRALHSRLICPRA